MCPDWLELQVLEHFVPALAISMLTISYILFFLKWKVPVEKLRGILREELNHLTAFYGLMHQ